MSWLVFCVREVATTPTPSCLPHSRPSDPRGSLNPLANGGSGNLRCREPLLTVWRRTKFRNLGEAPLGERSGFRGAKFRGPTPQEPFPTRVSSNGLGRRTLDPVMGVRAPSPARLLLPKPIHRPSWVSAAA